MQLLLGLDLITWMEEIRLLYFKLLVFEHVTVDLVPIYILLIIIYVEVQLLGLLRPELGTGTTAI